MRVVRFQLKKKRRKNPRKKNLTTTWDSVFLIRNVVTHSIKHYIRVRKVVLLMGIVCTWVGGAATSKFALFCQKVLWSSGLWV